MKKAGQDVVAIGLGIGLITGVTALTIFSSATFVYYLNKDADVKYVSAFNESVFNDPTLHTMSNDQRNDSHDLVKRGPLEDGTISEDQLSDENSSIEEQDTSPSNIIMNADDGAAVTYPYYIGKEFAVVDPDGNMVYIVKKGDTLSKISGILGYSVDELAEYNHIHNVNLIYVGESLRIPASPDLVNYPSPKGNGLS